MPSVTVRPLDLDAHIRGALECSVCLLPYNTTTAKPVQLDPCGHCFCTECASQLHDCPYCRATISQRIPNRGLFDVVTAVNFANNSSGDCGLTTPLLAQSSTSDDRQYSWSCLLERMGCFFDRMGALTLQGMSLLGRLLTIMCDGIGFLLKHVRNPRTGIIYLDAVVTLVLYVLVLTGLVMMRQSSVVRAYLAFYALRFGYFVYRSRFKELPSAAGLLWFYRQFPRHSWRLVWFFHRMFLFVTIRVIAFIFATSLYLLALDLHMSIQFRLKWEEYWPLVNIVIAILLMVCILLVVFLCATFRANYEGGNQISWSFSASLWNLLSAALDSFFVCLACLALVGYAYVNDDNVDGPQLCPSQPCPPTGCSLFWEVVKFCDRTMAVDFCGDVRT